MYDGTITGLDVLAICAVSVALGVLTGLVVLLIGKAMERRGPWESKRAHEEAQAALERACTPREYPRARELRGHVRGRV